MDKELHTKINEIIQNINWRKATKMPALTANSTLSDVLFARITEYAVADGLAAMKYSDSDGNIRQIIVFYKEHSASVFYINKRGIIKNRLFRNEALAMNRHMINSLGGSLHVNELIVRINNIANGIIDAYGQEYNHHTPVSMAPESFGPDEGSMCDRNHNKGDHKNICERIHNEVGIIPHVKSYYRSANNVYGLLGLRRQITLADLAQFNPRVVNGIYYFD